MTPVDIITAHEARVGSTTVRRTLPTRARRTVGSWCFADHMGPLDVTPTRGLDVGPHPHMGLQTVTWLIEGSVLHRDSLGNEQLISPGEVNIMSAGHGIAHSEEATGHYAGELEGIQLWLAQPEHTRHTPGSFEHHEEMPRVDLPGARATVIVGSFSGATSAARRDSDVVGVDLAVTSPQALELTDGYEYAVIALRGSVTVDGLNLDAGHLAYVAPGRGELSLDEPKNARLILLGGVPLQEPIEMWWNFVGRSREEFVDAYESWTSDDGRFGTVKSGLERILTTPPIKVPQHRPA